MDVIHYDVLENIISKLKLDDVINLIFSSKKIYRLYERDDEIYGCNKITNKIIRECSLFFKIDDAINKKYNNKKLLRDTFIKMYNIYKNNKNYDNADILIYIMENNIKSHEIFRCFCLKSKFCKNIEKYKQCENIGNYKQHENIIRYIDYGKEGTLQMPNSVRQGTFFFRNYEKNIISNSDMKYMLINLDKYKLEIILKVFHIESDIIAFCVNELLLHKKSEYDIKIKIFIDYIFYKYCFKEIKQHNKKYFIDIFTYFILYDESYLLKYFVTKLEKYSKVDILNTDDITCIIYNKLEYNNKNYYCYVKTCINNYVNCLVVK